MNFLLKDREEFKDLGSLHHISVDEDTLNYLLSEMSFLKKACELVKNFQDLRLSHPVYYYKGKNWPYFLCICLEPKFFFNESSNYVRYRGLYIDIDVVSWEITVYIDGTEVYSGNDLVKDLQGKESVVLNFIRDNLSEREQEFLLECLKMKI